MKQNKLTKREERNAKGEQGPLSDSSVKFSSCAPSQDSSPSLNNEGKIEVYNPNTGGYDFIDVSTAGKWIKLLSDKLMDICDMVGRQMREKEQWQIKFLDAKKEGNKEGYNQALDKAIIIVFNRSHTGELTYERIRKDLENLKRK